MLKLFVTIAALFTQAPDRGWSIDRLDLDVVVTPDAHMLQVTGLARLSYAGSKSNDLTLFFGPDGLSFDSAAASLPSSVTFNARRDSLFLKLAPSAKSRSELTVRFFGHTDRDIGRNLIRPQGAMMSWGALWYPVLAAAADSLLVIEFPGETRITVPAEWRTMSPGKREKPDGTSTRRACCAGGIAAFARYMRIYEPIVPVSQ